MTYNLETLYNELYGPLSNPGRLSNLAELSQRLAQAVGRSKPWSPRALNSILLKHKGFTLTDELTRAIEVCAARLDGGHPLQGLLVEVQAFSINGNIQPGSIITGSSARCCCGVLFVPHHPRQRYCCRECPSRRR